jgi:microcystin-dependent protein
MARAEIPFVVSKATGTVSGATASYAVSGASVLVNLRGGGPATVYAGETGGTTLPNPLTTTSDGRIDGWLDEGSYDMVISGSGITTYTQPIEVVRGDGVTRVAANAIGTTQIQTAAVTFAKLATDVIPGIIPSGVMWAFAGTVLPAGWLWCDGKAYNGTTGTYLSLWNAIGTAYGGTGQTNFFVPDYRGRTFVGADSLGTNGAAGRLTANNARGNASGFEAITLTSGQLPSHSHRGFDVGHSHGTNDPGHRHSLVGYATSSYYAGGTLPMAVYGSGDVDGTAHMGLSGTGVSIQTGFATIGVDDVGQTRGGSHGNMPPYQACGVIIKL